MALAALSCLQPEDFVPRCEDNLINWYSGQTPSFGKQFIKDLNDCLGKLKWILLPSEFALETKDKYQHASEFGSKFLALALEY